MRPTEATIHAKVIALMGGAHARVTDGTGELDVHVPLGASVIGRA